MQSNPVYDFVNENLPSEAEKSPNEENHYSDLSQGQNGKPNIIPSSGSNECLSKLGVKIVAVLAAASLILALVAICISLVLTQTRESSSNIDGEAETSQLERQFEYLKQLIDQQSDNTSNLLQIIEKKLQQQLNTSIHHYQGN